MNKLENNLLGLEGLWFPENIKNNVLMLYILYMYCENILYHEINVFPACRVLLKGSLKITLGDPVSHYHAYDICLP